MSHSSKRYAASTLGSTLLAFGRHRTQHAVRRRAAEHRRRRVGALAPRTLDPSLRVTGSGITDATVTPPRGVPEPGTMALLGLGLAAMIVSKRRKARETR